MGHTDTQSVYLHWMQASVTTKGMGMGRRGSRRAGRAARPLSGTGAGTLLAGHDARMPCGAKAEFAPPAPHGASAGPILRP